MMFLIKIMMTVSMMMTILMIIMMTMLMNMLFTFLKTFAEVRQMLKRFGRKLSKLTPQQFSRPLLRAHSAALN